MQNHQAMAERIRLIGEGDPAFSRSQHADVVTMFWDAVDSCPDRIALIEGERTLSYAQFGAAAAGLAQRIRETVPPAGRVAIFMPNSIEANVAMFAALCAGAEIAMINAAYTAREIDILFRIAPPQLVLTGNGNRKIIEPCAETVGAARIALGEDALSINEMVAAACSRPEVEITGDSPCIIMFTGGTTGSPKGVQRNHRSEMKVIHSMHAAWPTRLMDEVWLNVAPVSHVWGAHMGCFNPVYSRAPLVIVPRYHPDLVTALLEKHRVTIFTGGPAAIYQGLLDSPVGDLSSMWLCPAGGSVFSRQLLSRWEAKTGRPILEAYGMTEGGPLTAQPLDGTHRYGTAGRPLPGVEVAIAALDGSGRRLPPCENGEILIRGERVIDRYMGGERIPDDGWLPTGDIGFIDKEGFLTVVDRKKDMLIVGGFNVYPSEIEEVLSMVPDVTDVAVVAVADERKGEVPFAFVTCSPISQVNERRLLDHCARHLTSFKIPRNIAVIDEIPKTAARKSDKNRLVVMAGEWLEKQRKI